MQFSWKSVGKVVELWIGLMGLLWSHVFLGREKITIFLLYGYMIITSFSLTHFEKSSIIERFGFQRKNVLGLLFVICLGLTIVYFVYNFDINDFDRIILAPFVEEIFFRGYMLGALYKRNQNEWKGIPIEYLWILLTSSLFALSHIFVYYPNFPLSMWIEIWRVGIGSLLYGLFYVWSRTVLWCVWVHMLYNLYPPFKRPEICVSSIVFIVSLVYTAFKRARARN